MRLIRVFPTRTNATPTDDLVRFGPPGFIGDEADEVHISVAFTWDIPAAERLAEQWRVVTSKVEIGGPAFEKDRRLYPVDFTPGRYIKAGYTITSRGCPRRCWFCSVWRRWPEPTPNRDFADGYNILDDNLLACPRDHVERVFAMLRKRSERVQFTGGLEALSLQDYQVDLLAGLARKPVCFFAYDPGDDFDTIASAANRLIKAGFTKASHRLRCYVLIGHPRDTLTDAETRLNRVLSVGMTPMAMLWRPESPAQRRLSPGRDWERLQRVWARPAIIHSDAEAA